MGWNIGLPPPVWVPQGDPRIHALVREVEDNPVVAIDTETTGLNKEKCIPLFWSLSWGENRFCMPSSTLHFFKKAFDDPYKTWVFANAKFDMHMIANFGIKFAGNIADTCVMHALLFDEQSHSLEAMAKHMLGWQWKDDFKAGFRKEGAENFLLRLEREDLPRLVNYASNDAYGTWKLYWKLKEHLEGAVTHALYQGKRWEGHPMYVRTLWDYFEKIEKHFTKVLWSCERKGVQLDLQYLESIETPLQKRIDEIAREANQIAGKMVNLNSTKQMKEYYFDTLHLKSVHLTKGGKSGIRSPSIDEEFLVEYRNAVPMAKIHLEYRELDKLMGTYVKGLKDRVDQYGRVHTKFNQDVARCMPAGELVLTNRGYIPVQHVEVGDLVVTHEGRARPVTEVSTHNPQVLYRVELSNGLILRTTGNHQYRTPDGWVRADALNAGDEVIAHSDEEVWSPITGWEDYQVSSWGRVYSNRTARVLSLQPKGKWGHLKVTLKNKKGVRKDFSVHRLVATAFCPANRGCGHEVRHLDGVAWNNTRENLLWGTSKENTEDSRRHGTLNGAPILTPEQVEEIRNTNSAGQPPSSSSKLTFEIAEEIRGRFAAGEGRAELAREFEVSYQAIDSIVKDRTWLKPPSGTSATELAEKYGVSPAAIRDIWAGRRWDRDLSERSCTQQFRRVTVESVCILKEEVTYGLTVEEDHSHVTGGIVTHNTGRLSSSDPNCQNIPRPDSDKFKLRKAFIAPEGKTLIVADYEQLEMRLLAAATVNKDFPMGEVDMVNLFLSGKDIHMGNAALVFGPGVAKRFGRSQPFEYEDFAKAKKIDKGVKEGKFPASELTAVVQALMDARQAVKTIGFGINYGMKEKKLANDLTAAGVPTSPEEAAVLIETYLDRLPAVKRFFVDAVEEARYTGFAYTILGRRRFLPEILSENNMERFQAERQSGNCQIQGTAAEVAKMAMIHCYNAGLDKKYGCDMEIQVHDELMFECPTETAQEAGEEITEHMEHPLPTDLAVPLTISMGKGRSWCDAK